MKELLISTEKIIDCLNDGVYVCDRDRRIVYWNKSAERITGWRSEDVVGRPCRDGVLNHIDKDGHRLCGPEHCPFTPYHGHRGYDQGAGNRFCTVQEW